MRLGRLFFAGLGWVGVVLAGLGVPAALGATGDEVVMQNGQVNKGRVLKDDVSGVMIKLATGGGTMTFKAEEVKEIRYGVTHHEYLRAIREIGQGAPSSALESLESLCDKETLKTIQPDVARAYIMYLYGEVLYQCGRTDQAVTAFKAFMEANPTSRYMPMAVGSLVDAAIQVGKFQMVPELLTKLKATGNEGLALAQYYEGKLILKQGGDKNSASNKFAESASTTRNPETKALARLGEGECAIEKGDFAKAKALAEEALSSTKVESVLGTAYLIVGRAHFEEAEKIGGQAAEEKYLDALLCFLRIPVLYRGDRRTEPEAVYRSGECFQRLSRQPARTKDKQRALRQYSTVIQTYRGTYWAKKADEAMKKIK